MKKYKPYWIYLILFLTIIDDAFVEFSFNQISKLVKNIELSYIEFDKRNQVTKMMKNLDIPDEN